LAAPNAGSALSRLEACARTAMTQLAGARRANRWCEELPVIASIPRSLAIQDPFDRLMEVLQKAFLAAFLIVDHVGLLKQWNIWPGGKRSGICTIRLGLKLFCFSNMLGAAIQINRFLGLIRQEDRQQDEIACLKLALRHVLLLFQTAHLSLLCRSHDVLVGIAGMITSSMDLRAQCSPKSPFGACSPRSSGRSTPLAGGACAKAEFPRLA